MTDNVPTVAATGVLAACTASAAHEALGHGAACLAQGGTVTLLTATHFGCEGAGVLVDGAGPLGNLVCGLVALALLRTVGSKHAAIGLFLFMLATLNLCWLGAELIYSAALDVADAANVARRMDWPALWRPAALGLGLVVYAATLRTLTRDARALASPEEAPDRLRARVGWAHLAATVAFTGAGFLWAGDRMGSAWEAFLIVGLAAAPIWLTVARARRLGVTATAPRPVRFSAAWVVAAAVVGMAFGLTQGIGLGRLAGG